MRHLVLALVLAAPLACRGGDASNPGPSDAPSAAADAAASRAPAPDAPVLAASSLSPGAHPVGFRVRYEDDRSRAWLTDPVEPDHRFALEHPRAVRVMEWYPAAAQGTMPFETYVEPAAPGARPDVARMNAFLGARDREAYRRDVGDALDDLLHRNVRVSLDAPAASGRFPLVVYAAGWNSLSPDNVLLAEHLASEGFVVVTVPQLPSTASRRELAVDAADLETQMRDLEVALGTAAEWSEVDAKRIALIGYSMGGVAALWLAARHPMVRAIVGLDPSFVAPEWRAFAFAGVDPWNVRVPILVLGRGRSDGDSVEAALAPLAYADRWVATFSNATHGDFGHEPSVTRAVLGGGPERDAAAARHDAIVDLATRFLDATLVAESAGAPPPDPLASDAGSEATLARLPGAHIPTASDYANAARTAPGDVRRVYEDARAQYPGAPIVRESELNAAGYRLLAEGHPSEAVAVLELATLAFPASANALDSLADAYDAAGDPKRVADCYRKLLDVLPRDPTLSPRLREHLAANARARLAAPPK